ncbi:MAG: hypothetical protein D6784_05965 [Chloroflexi bacterium]|nr:MAG: hypothetical protein D6784_05965 [Chloroflexota bacterium]
MVLDSTRVIFLVLLVLTAGVMFLRTRGALLAAIQPGEMILNFILVILMAATVFTFFIILFRIDPMPYLRRAAYNLSFQQLISFESAVPPDLQKNFSVSNVERTDTDGDNFEEWVVHYRFNTRNGRGPLQVVIYDNDRGNPPVIFPYVLRVPGRDYLSEGDAEVSLFDVTDTDTNGPNGENLPELLVQGDNELSIFRFQQNSEPWDFPRDIPPRYDPIGFFRGSGGVSIDQATRNVTVIDRKSLSRSQLVVRSVYRLNPDLQTYWDQYYAPGEMNRRLAAPAFSTVDFWGEPPEDITSVTFPEMIVLAFYASTCAGGEDGQTSLCKETYANWDPADFLAGDAEVEYRAGNAAYFGLSGFGDTFALSVSKIAYYPNLETDADLSASGAARDTVIGELPRQNVVQITFTVNGLEEPTTARYLVEQVGGKWKITRRLPFENLPELGPPDQINTAPQ